MIPPKLILIEDDDAYRYVLGRELRAIGFDVIDFRLTTEGLEHLEQAPDIRLAVVDLHMPVHTPDGLGFARMMRQLDPHVRVALMTAYPNCLQIPETEAFGGILFKIPDAAVMVLMVQERLALRAQG